MGTYIEVNKKVKGWKREAELLKMMGFIKCDDLSDKNKIVMWHEGEWEVNELFDLLSG